MFDASLSPSLLKQLTVPQLKQQLRLRGLKVTGNKQDLVNRLLEEGRAFDDELLSTFGTGGDNGSGIVVLLLRQIIISVAVIMLEEIIMILWNPMLYFLKHVPMK